MDANVSKATPTASQAWWLTRALAAHPVPLFVGAYFNKNRLQSLNACICRRWLSTVIQPGGTMIVRVHLTSIDITRDAFNRFIAAGK